MSIKSVIKKVIHHPRQMWAARKIFRLRPSEHYDIGSRVDGIG